MSNEQKKNEIDEIFRKAIEPFPTKPSEQFWRKAAENIVVRGNKLSESNAFRWKVISFILGAGILLLGYYTVSGLKKVEKQMSVISKAQNQNPIKDNKAINNAVYTLNDNAIVTVANKSVKQPVSLNKENKTNSSVRSEEAGTRLHSSYGNKRSKVQTTQVVFNNSFNSGKQNQKAVEPVVDIADENSDSKNQEKSVIQSRIKDNSANNLTLTENPSLTPKRTEYTPINNAQQVDTCIVKAGKKTTPSIANDTTKAVYLIDSLAGSNISRFTISAFFSPDFMMGYKFKSTDSWGSQLMNTIKTDEKQNFSYTVGAKAEYMLSSHFSISAGIAYQAFSFNINPGVIYAHKQPDGDIGYYIATSSGIVECPYYGTLKAGDSLKINASSTRSYLEIPVDVKYSFIDKTKYSFYVSGAIETNIAIEQRTAMNWQSFGYESGQATVTNTEGSANMYFSYYMGIGADYKIGKSLSLYIEPGVHDAITSLDNNIAAISYPRLFSITAGLTYYIK